MTEYLVTTFKNDVLVSIKGLAVYTTCNDFAKFLEVIGKDENYKKLIVDFNECTGVDSTLLGLLTQAANDMRERGAELILQRANKRIEEVIINLGLEILATVLKGGITHAGTDEILSSGTQSSREASPADNATILAAHESLIETSNENAQKFKQIVEFMRADLGLK
ncbi:MAG: STAS domain-containing protein [Opitutales bacterium]|nr:STAS domain-containing protein [Opitutales bacterium]